MDMYSLYNNTKEWFDLVDILYAEEEIHSGNNLERVLKINLNRKLQVEIEHFSNQ